MKEEGGAGQGASEINICIRTSSRTEKGCGLRRVVSSGGRRRMNCEAYVASGAMRRRHSSTKKALRARIARTVAGGMGLVTLTKRMKNCGVGELLSAWQSCKTKPFAKGILEEGRHFTPVLFMPLGLLDSLMVVLSQLG